MKPLLIVFSAVAAFAVVSGLAPAEATQTPARQPYANANEPLSLPQAAVVLSERNYFQAPGYPVDAEAALCGMRRKPALRRELGIQSCK